MMEDEVVKKRKWMTQEHFLDLMGATNLIPGPNSTEMTMHCGYERAGWKGLFGAGFCFIFPAVIITAIFAWGYQEYGKLPEVTPFIYGIKPAVIAIIAMAAYRLGKKAVKSTQLAVLGGIALVACFFGMNEIVVLFGCGFLALTFYFFTQKNSHLSVFLPLLWMQEVALAKITNLKIGFTFLKIGAILYGSGYVLFAFLDAELVGNGWLSRQELIDAVAIGQITPGPVLSTATFIGWQMNGVEGALVATLGIFFPSFLFVLLLNPIIPKMRKSKPVGKFLDGVNVAAVALIVAVCFAIGKETILDGRTLIISLASFAVVFFFKKVNNGLIVAGGAVLGYILSLF